MLSGCRAGLLKEILDESVPFVWVLDHAPVERCGWWKTSLSLREHGPSFELDVRGVVFDIQLSTKRFLEILPEFQHLGLNLYQMHNKVPNTLTLSGVDDRAVNTILIQNGLHLHFQLPHEDECALLSAPRRETLERALSNPVIRERAY